MNKPNQCAILAVDTARNSGWALFSCGVKIDSGEVNIDDREAVLAICAAAVGCMLRAVLVLEAPWGGRKHTLLGLGGAREVWLHAWRKANKTKTTRRVVSVLPQVWRGPLGLKRKVDPRMQDQILASFDLKYITRGVGPDEFEALLIGYWATHSRKVAALLPDKMRAAAA